MMNIPSFIPNLSFSATDMDDAPCCIICIQFRFRSLLCLCLSACTNTLGNTFAPQGFILGFLYLLPILSACAACRAFHPPKSPASSTTRGGSVTCFFFHMLSLWGAAGTCNGEVGEGAEKIEESIVGHPSIPLLLTRPGKIVLGKGLEWGNHFPLFFGDLGSQKNLGEELPEKIGGKMALLVACALLRTVFSWLVLGYLTLTTLACQKKYR